MLLEVMPIFVVWPLWFLLVSIFIFCYVMLSIIRPGMQGTGIMYVAGSYAYFGCLASI